MNSNLMVNTCIHVSLGILLLLVVYQFAIKKTILDSLRQDMFALRDELFDWFMANSLSHDLDAHKALRHKMNNFISYAPLLTIYTLWSFRLGGLNTADNSEVHSDGDEWVEQIPESLRKQYTPFLCRMRLLVYRQMALSSLPGLVLMGPTYLRTRMDMQKCVQTGAICGGPMSREEKSHAQEINILATGFDAINREPDLARNLGVPA